MSQGTPEQFSRLVFPENVEIPTHPSEYINRYLGFYVASYLEKANFRKTGSKINNACFRFLENSKIPMSHQEYLSAGHDLVEKAARIQKELLTSNPKNASIRHALKDNPDLRPFVGLGVGGQCLMLSAYCPFLENLWEVDAGKKKYGLGEELYRLQPDNALGSGLMMEQAATRIAVKSADLFGSAENVVYWEFGSGTGATLAAISEEYLKRGLKLPGIISSDIDPKTRVTAKNLFMQRGLGDVRWEQVDIRNSEHLARVATGLEGKTVVLLVGFIYHENRNLATKSMQATAKEIPRATIAATEYLRPQVPMAYNPQRPYWFEGIHDMTQDLFEGKSGFLDFAREVGGYSLFDEVVHQKLEGLQDPLNATLFLRKT